MASRGHTYEITVRPLALPDGSPAVAEPITFHHRNHDDILAILGRVRLATGLDPDAATATVVGLKLLSEVALQSKGDLYAPLLPALREFVTNLKTLTQADDRAGSR